MISIKPLSGISFEKIYLVFKNAFSDYVEPMDRTQAELLHMIERRGCNFDLSVGAFDGDELVGLTLNGVGNWNGKYTSYDTGTGVVKEYRKQGIATKMFIESLPILRDNGIEHYLLEVIKSNTGAYELYKKAGFKVVRELDYFISTREKLKMTSMVKGEKSKVKETKNPDWELLQSFWEFEPSWQNSIDSINRKLDHFKIIVIYENEELAGYGIIEPSTGDIPQFAISKKYRRKGLATRLLKELIKLDEVDEIRFVNPDASYEPFKKFMTSVGLKPGDGQYEMIMEL